MKARSTTEREHIFYHIVLSLVLKEEFFLDSYKMTGNIFLQNYFQVLPEIQIKSSVKFRSLSICKNSFLIFRKETREILITSGTNEKL